MESLLVTAFPSRWCHWLLSPPFLQQVIILRTIHYLVTVNFHLTLEKSTPYKFQWQIRFGRLIDQSSFPVYLSYDSFEFSVCYQFRLIFPLQKENCKDRFELCEWQFGSSLISFPLSIHVAPHIPIILSTGILFLDIRCPPRIICLFESRSTAHG